MAAVHVLRPWTSGSVLLKRIPLASLLIRRSLHSPIVCSPKNKEKEMACVPQVKELQCINYKVFWPLD